jgi:hypothetical protein
MDSNLMNNFNGALAPGIRTSREGPPDGRLSALIRPCAFDLLPGDVIVLWPNKADIPQSLIEFSISLSNGFHYRRGDQTEEL